MSGQGDTPKYATVVWEGDAREVLQAFPEDVKQNFGFELWQLQQGERPFNYRPLPSIGREFLDCEIKTREPGIELFTYRD